MPAVLSKSKLTLWVDKEVKRFGKEWAKKHHESLSLLVSDYLRRLRAAETRAYHPTPLVKQLSGVVKGRKLDRGSYYKYLDKKYLGL